MTLANSSHRAAPRKDLGPAVVYARISMQNDERTASLARIIQTCANKEASGSV